MKRGEIWQINLDPTIGAEIQKSRPAVIISIDAIGVLPLRLIVPVTGWKKHFNDASWLVSLEPESGNRLQKKSAADTFQIRCVSESRFLTRLGVISQNDILRIENSIRLVMGL